MTVAAEPRHALVLLEPRDRITLDTEQQALIEEVEHELPAEIVSPQEYAALADFDRRLGEFIKRTKPMFDQHCDDAYKVWKQATGIRELFVGPLENLKTRIRSLISGYKAREEQARREEERRLAFEEHQRLEAQRKQEAKLAEQQGQKELAKAIRATPVETPTVVLPSTLPDVGLSFRDDWTWEPVGGNTPANRVRALKMIVPERYVSLVRFDDAAMRAFANQTKGEVRVPGIRFYQKPVPVRR